MGHGNGLFTTPRYFMPCSRRRNWKLNSKQNHAQRRRSNMCASAVVLITASNTVETTLSLQRVTACDSSEPGGLLAELLHYRHSWFCRHAHLPDHYDGFPPPCTDAKDAVHGKHSRACPVFHTYSTIDDLSEYLVGPTAIPTAAAISCLDGNRLAY